MKNMLMNKFLRNEKNSEAPLNWPDNIKIIEQEAIELKKISQDITKRLLLCPVFSGYSSTISSIGNQNWPKMANDTDKQSKVAEINLGQCFSVSSEKLSLINPNISKILSILCDANEKLATERLNWASNVENNVLERLKQCYENSVPCLIKTRRQLWKQNSDLKVLQDKIKSLENNSNLLMPNSPVLASSVQNNLTTPSHIMGELTTSNSGLNPSSNGVANTNYHNGQSSPHENSKVNQLKSTRDDLEIQLDHLKDLSLREHYRFEGSTVDISKSLVNLLKNEVTYHEQCLKIIGDYLPDLESSIGNNPIPVFGRELSQHLLTSHRHIAYTLEVCIRHLDNTDVLSEEGLFRIAGGKSKVDTLTSAFNVFRAEKIIDLYDHFVVADCLKKYLRSLPQPLLTHYLFDDWIQTFRHKDLKARLFEMNICLSKLPVAYLNNLSYLIGFLYKLSTFSDTNKMTPTNLGIIFGPNLLSSNTPSKDTCNHSLDLSTSERKKMRNCYNSKPVMKNRSFNSYDLEHNDRSAVRDFALSTVEFTGLEKQRGQWDDSNALTSMFASSTPCLVIETLIRNFKYFFPTQSIQFTTDIPPKVFPQHFCNKRQSGFYNLGSNNKAHINHKVNTMLPEKSIPFESISDVNFKFSNKVSKKTATHFLNPLEQSGVTDEYKEHKGDFMPKSFVTTPTDKKAFEFSNGTVFPSCLFQRRVSEGTLDTITIHNGDNSIGCNGVKCFSDMGSSCLEDSQSSTKSSNDASSKYDGTSIEPPESSSKSKCVTKSFHADVYDTLFALHSLKAYTSTADNYLSRVRSTYEERTLSKPSGISRTPLIKRQIINTSLIEDPMSKSVTNDSSLMFSKEVDAHSLYTASDVRRPQLLRNTKLKNYRASSPGNIESISTESIDSVTTNMTQKDKHTSSSEDSNQLVLNNKDSPVAISPKMRYSMPILSSKNVSGYTTFNSDNF